MIGISNGQLLQMDEQKRIKTISKLPEKVRAELALIANLGAARCLKKSNEYRLRGMDRNAEERINHSHELTTLAYDLVIDSRKNNKSNADNQELRNRLKEAGEDFKKIKNRQKLLTREAYSKGMTSSEIGNLLGVGMSTVSRWS